MGITDSLDKTTQISISLGITSSGKTSYKSVSDVEKFIFSFTVVKGKYFSSERKIYHLDWKYLIIFSQFASFLGLFAL